jgi:hypothetical protein
MSFTSINFFIVVLLMLSVASQGPCLVKASVDMTPSFRDMQSNLQRAENDKLFHIGLDETCEQRVFSNKYQYNKAINGCNDKSILPAVILNLNEKNIKASLIYGVNNIANTIYEEYFAYPFYYQRKYEIIDKQIDEMHYILDNVDNIFFAYIQSSLNIHDYCRTYIEKYKSEFEYYPYWGLGEYFGSSKIMPTQEQQKYTDNLKSMCEKAKKLF